MLRPAIVPLLLGLGMLAARPCPAGTLHITDQLLAGLYPKPDPTSEPIQLLSSGTPMDELQRQDGYVRVRLPDHTTGWVESIYLTEDTPAQVLLLQAQAKMRRLHQEVGDLRARLEAHGEAVAAGGAQTAVAAECAPTTEEGPIASSHPRVVSIEAGPAQPMGYSPLWGLVGLTSACLVAFLGGMVFQDRRGGR